MNKFAIATLLSVFMISPAVADNATVVDSEGTIHVGFKMGQSNISGSRSGFGIQGSYTLLSPGYFQLAYLDRTSIAVEGEFVNLGTYRNTSNSFSAAAYGVAGTAAYPVGPSVNVVAKAGLANLSRKQGCGWTTCTNTSSSSDFGLHFGVAGQYNLASDLSLGVGYDLYPGKITIFSVNAVYTFLPSSSRSKPAKPVSDGILRIEGIEPSPLFPF